MNQRARISVFNEGKACDAVIRWKEWQANSSRTALQLPEAEQHEAPIEVACIIAGELHAFEHTGIEPFLNQIRMGVDSAKLFGPLQTQLLGKLPNEGSFDLYVPVGATQSLRPKQVLKIQRLLIDWIAKEAVICPVARPGRVITPILSTNLEDVPFPVSLHRNEPLGPEFAGRLDVRHVLQGDLEEARHERILKAYNDKKDKLATWKKDLNARTVLVLEENDIQLTNHQLVVEAVRRIEQTAQGKPDDIFLVSTHLSNRWRVIPIRLGKEFCELNGRDRHLLEFDPDVLTQITSR